MRPIGLAAAVGLFEAAALDVLLWARLEEDHRAVLLSVVDAAVREGDRALLHAPAAGLVALVPHHLAGLELQAGQVAALVAAAAAVQVAVVQDHAAVVVLHPAG